MEHGRRSDSTYRWTVLAAAFTVNFLGDGLLSSFGVLLVELVDEFRDSTASVAAIGAIALGVFSLTSPFAGSLSDAAGKKKVALAGATVFFIGFLASSFAPSIQVLYLTYSVMAGVGFSLLYNPANTSVMEHFTTQRSLASGVALCGSGVGTFVLTMLTSRLIQVYGWRGALLVLSAVLLHCVPCALVLRVPNHKCKHTDPEQALIPGKCLNIETNDSVREKSRYNMLKILLTDNLAFFKDLNFCCLMVSAFFYGLAFFIPFALLPKQVDSMGIGKLEASWLMSSLGISNTVGRIVFGWLGDRRFARTELSIGATLVLISASMSTSILLTTFQTKMIFTCIYGTLFGGYISLMATVLAVTEGIENFGRTFGIFWFVFDAASLIGTPLAGMTFDTTGSFTVCYMLAGSECLGAAAITLIPWLRQTCSLSQRSDVTREALSCIDLDLVERHQC